MNNLYPVFDGEFLIESAAVIKVGGCLMCGRASPLRYIFIGAFRSAVLGSVRFGCVVDRKRAIKIVRRTT